MIPRIRSTLAALALLAMGAAAIASVDVTYQLVASGLERPVDIENARDGSNRLFVVEQLRGIRVIKGGVLLSEPFLDLSAVVSQAAPNAGITGLAFDPLYATNRRFFVAYVRASDGALRVESYAASAANPDVADPASAIEILTIPHPGSNERYGGHLAFGPDGMLFLSTGDCSGGEAQDLASLWGKMLRLDVRGASGYLVPPDNYHVATANAAARPEIVARGLNDPRSFSFDPVLGDLYIGDVGFGTQEVDTMPNGYWRSADMNYGAPSCTGTSGCAPGIATPQAVHAGDAITAGIVYRGAHSYVLYGRYLYGARGGPSIWAARHDGNAWSEDTLAPNVPGTQGAAAFGVDEAGEPRFATYGDGALYAITGGGFTRMSRFASPSGQRPDFNGDGREDILWEQEIPHFYRLATMNGGNVLTTADLVPPEPTSADRWPRVWDIGPFHGGARSDVLWRGFDGSYWLSINEPSGITATRIYTAGGPWVWEVVEAGDFNGDGKRDLLWRKDNQYGIWLMNGSTPLATGAIVAPDPGYPYTWANAAAIGDFNGDGKSDIVWYRPGDGSAALSLMDGLTTLWSATVFQPMAKRWVPIAAADFNGDGKSDIVWELPNHALGLWLMDGNAPPVYGVVSWGAPDNQLRFRYARDMDGDGKADIVWDDGAGGGAVWLMDGLQVREKIHLWYGSHLSLAGIGDYDGDGKANLLLVTDPDHLWSISTAIAPLILVPLPDMPGYHWMNWE